MNYSESMIQSFKNCPRQARYKYDLRLEKEKEDKDEHHLKYGSAGHASLEVLYKGGSVSESKKAFKEIYPRQLDTEDNAKTESNWFNLIDTYEKGQLREDLRRYEILESEKYDKFEFAGEEGFVVKLDMIIRDRQDGGIYGLDWKITGGSKAYLPQDKFWGQFNPNSQITKYMASIKSKYGHCAGFFVHGFGMGYRSRAYKGEPAGTWFRHQRMEFNRTPDQLEEEERDTREWIGRVEYAKSHNEWPKNTQSCMFCEFKPICQAGYQWPEDRELIEITYRQKELYAR